MYHMVQFVKPLQWVEERARSLSPIRGSVHSQAFGACVLLYGKRLTWRRWLRLMVSGLYIYYFVVIAICTALRHREMLTKMLYLWLTYLYSDSMVSAGFGNRVSTKQCYPFLLSVELNIKSICVSFLLRMTVLLKSVIDCPNFFYINNIANELRQSFVMVFLKNVLIFFNVEKHLLHSLVHIDVLQIMFKTL